MAGRGSRFVEQGYTQPKPLIPVLGKPMISRVIDNLYHSDINFIFIMLEEHSKNHKVDKLLNQILKHNCEIILSKEVTEGPASTCLLAKEYINNNEALCIINADQIIEDLNWDTFWKFVNGNRFIDGALGTFESIEQKNSYVQVDEYGWVTEAREKEVISNIATNGLHYWKKGRYFVESAEKMIEEDDRVNGEFYVAPTYNYMVGSGRKVTIYPFEQHFPIGTPEDLKIYEEHVMRK